MLSSLRSAYIPRKFNRLGLFSTYLCNDQPNCTLSRSITPNQRILYTLGASKNFIKDMGKIEFIDIVPKGNRLEGGIQPSVFAYIEGESNTSVQLLTPYPVWGEVIEVNEEPLTTAVSEPDGFLIRIDGGEVEDEDDDYIEWVKEQQPIIHTPVNE